MPWRRWWNVWKFFVAGAVCILALNQVPGFHRFVRPVLYLSLMGLLYICNMDFLHANFRRAAHRVKEESPNITDISPLGADEKRDFTADIPMTPKKEK